MQMTIYSLTDPSHTAKKKTYCHDNDMKYFRNNIICGSFYQRYCLILPSPSKLKHDFATCYVFYIRHCRAM